MIGLALTRRLRSGRRLMLSAAPASGRNHMNHMQSPSEISALSQE